MKRNDEKACGDVGGRRTGEYLEAKTFFVFFLVSGVGGELRVNAALRTRDGEAVSTRPLRPDINILAETLDCFPGAVVVPIGSIVKHA
ncbi:TPA: hypothetical protein QDB08_001188 [Burkholderia vietnamiensis]|uniref:hypothetical protein n=1 Tax=Burkholderia vietnamiensis TaxID=60552 RepID=UPI001ABAD876|nr:hypothetical protein [Burkholderia vietnamiensis]HDR9008258.1 hypothetical protein [Burkholderia vietnamiensis]HDR9017562.1 hypothetical protein [Burkholderia vietnamiensis]